MTANRRLRPVVVALAASERISCGRRVLEALRRSGAESHLVLATEAAAALGRDAEAVQALADHAYAEDNQAARISSGSFLTQGMIVAPCDGRALAAIVTGLATNLVYRAADVTLKEARPLVLGVPPPELQRVPPSILERAAAVPGLAVLALDEPDDDAAAAALLARIGIEAVPPGT